MNFTISAAQVRKYVSNRFRYSQASITPADFACSATVRILSIPHFHSSCVGPWPLNNPIAEWNGPHSDVAPSARQQSSVRLVASMPAARTLASGEMGLSTSVRIVTAVRSKPRSSSRLAQGRKLAGSPPKMGTSTPSYPIFLSFSRTGSMLSLSSPDHSSRFIPNFIQYRRSRFWQLEAGASRPVEQFVRFIIADELL